MATLQSSEGEGPPDVTSPEKNKDILHNVKFCSLAVSS